MIVPRLPLAGMALLLVVFAVGGSGWWWWHRNADSPLPTPPAPPRLVDHPAYERCLEAAEEDPQGARALAEQLTLSGQEEAARHCSALALLTLGEAAAAAEALEQLASASSAPPRLRAALFGQASQAWIAAGRPERAIAALSLALTLSPEDPDLLTERAIAALALERPADALADAERATSLAPNRVEAWIARARAERQLDRLKAATISSERALALAADDPEALLERGIVRYLRGDRVGARADWERVVAVAPDSTAADLAAQNLALMEAGPAPP